MALLPPIQFYSYHFITIRVCIAIVLEAVRIRPASPALVTDTPLYFLYLFGNKFLTEDEAEVYLWGWKSHHCLKFDCSCTDIGSFGIPDFKQRSNCLCCYLSDLISPRKTEEGHMTIWLEACPSQVIALWVHTSNGRTAGASLTG